MHEPVEILSPSRRSSPSPLSLPLSLSLSLPPPWPSSFELGSSLFLVFSFACSSLLFLFLPSLRRSPRSLLFLLLPFALAARDYWPLSNLIFAHSGDAEKHLRAIKDRADGRCKLRSERKKERRQKKEKYRREKVDVPGGGTVHICPTAKLTGERVTAERSSTNVKCHDAIIDSECRRRDAP